MKKLIFFVLVSAVMLGMPMSGFCQETLWEIGTPHGNVDPIDGAAEYPANDNFYTVYDYDVEDADLPPGYIGPANVCDIDPERPCTDTTAKLNINFSLECDTGDLTFFYDRYGSEEDILYLDGVQFGTASATESGFRQFSFNLGQLELGEHTITIEYAGGGSGNGHYIDYAKLEAEWQATCVSLCAGQFDDVGHVAVWDDADNLYVKYVITDPEACLTETHLHVADGLDAIPTTKGKTNPIPGKFDYKEEHSCIENYTYTVPKIEDVDDYTIAAHAALQIYSNSYGGECASLVEAYDQGTLQNGNEITDNERTDPSKALGEADSETDNNFYSLGFDGYLTLSFENFISGYLTVYEVTNGDYPLEQAEVQVSRDGANWKSLGMADNTGSSASRVKASTFWLNDCYKYVKLIDDTERSNFSSRPSADGFDVDAVCADTICDEETAWAAGPCYDERQLYFNQKNWATYFTYSVK